MWVAALKGRGEFEGIREHLESLGSHQYKRVTTGTGGEVLQAPEESGWPHLMLIPDDPQRLKAIAQWVHRNLAVTAVISSGLINPCVPAAGEQPYFIPSLCLKSAGRVDIGGGVVLYEEIPFDREIQQAITQTLRDQRSEDADRIFCADRPIHDAETKRWIFANLTAAGTDDFTAELSLISKRFGTRVGCFKVFENRKDPIQDLKKGWELLSLTK